MAMATMKSQTSSSSSITCEWTYDVFISFRGVDTRSNFTGYVYNDLRGKGINAFMDGEDLKPGEEITLALDKAIQESRIALVIFSENYASSTFCLEELSKIVECSKDKGMLVCPVFYHINPAEVRHQKGSYAEALTMHEGRFEKGKVEKWRAALKKVADISGWHIRPDTDRHESEFINKIFQDISKKISSLDDGDKNQISCNVDDKSIAQQDRQPKPQSSSLKHLEVKQLPDKHFDYDKTSHKYRDLTTLRIAFHHATKKDVVIHTIRLSKQSVVEDLINDLKSKVDLSDPRAELRLLGYSDHTSKTFSLREKIGNISGRYETIIAEEIPEVEKNLDTGDKLVQVYHFKKTHNKQIQTFGDPFSLKIYAHEKLIDIKSRIQQILQVPYVEISKWKFASVHFNDAEYLENVKYPDSISSRFKSGSTYGEWEQYLGLEHDGSV